MTTSYITKIKANINIYASKKTSNILDGAYKSIYKGRSLDFDDLREYVLGDNIKDIDWKSSIRSGTILVKRFIAEKKHNIMLVLDTGIKMLADTKDGESKKDVAIMSAGILAYITNRHGDEISAIYSKNNSIEFYPFKSNLYNIERILNNYENDIKTDNKLEINDVLEYISNHINKKMIVFVITDLSGMESVQSKTLHKVSILHDVMFINISDAYMTGSHAYDMDNQFYIPDLILKDDKLHELEKKKRKEVYSNCTERFKRVRSSTVTINNIKEIVIKIIDLLERHKNANIR